MDELAANISRISLANSCERSRVRGNRFKTHAKRVADLRIEPEKFQSPQECYVVTTSTDTTKLKFQTRSPRKGDRAGRDGSSSAWKGRAGQGEKEE